MIKNKFNSKLLTELLKRLPVQVFWKDINGIYIGCNDAFVHSLGLSSQDEIIGKTDLRLPIKIAEAATYHKNDLEIIKTGQPKLDIEEEQTFPNGKKINLLTSKVPVFDERNEVIGVLGIYNNITDLKNTQRKAEESSKAKSEFIKEVVNILPQYIFWKDSNSMFVGCNASFAKLVGLDCPEQIIGKTDYDLPWSKSESDSYCKDDQIIIKSGIPRLFYEEAQLQSDGVKHTVLVSKIPTQLDKGIPGLLCIYQDITDLKEAQQKAEESSRAKSEFISNMSHDLRTPITGMLGIAQSILYTADDIKKTLGETQPDNDNTRLLNSLTEVKNELELDGRLLTTATEELLQLCNEILEVVSLESGHIQEKEKGYNFRELVQHNIRLLQPVAQHRKLALSMDVGDNVPTYITGLRTYLDRTLLNLIGNALKFTSEGFVKVTAELLDENHRYYSDTHSATLKINVIDTGKGIPENKFDVIFEHFSRLTSSYDGVYKGSGLGLYTVKKYVEAMGGKIQVKSKLNEGSCFSIILPVRKSTPSEIPPHTMHPQRYYTYNTTNEIFATPIKKPMNAMASLLVVEDNSMAAKAIIVTLKPFQCTIDLVKNGTEAVTLASKNDYDLIIMDIGLPDFSGIDATKIIRALDNPKRSQVQIIAITGHANNPEMRQKSLDAGIQEVLSKPAQPLVLESILQKYVFRIKTQSPSTQQISTPNDQTSEILAVIDWNTCVRMCNGDPDFTRKMLGLLADDLKNTKSVLAEGYANNDT